MDGLKRKLREYTVPEVLDTYLSTDDEVLKMLGYRPFVPRHSSSRSSPPY